MASPQELKAVDRPLFKDFWERFLDSLRALEDTTCDTERRQQRERHRWQAERPIDQGTLFTGKLEITPSGVDFPVDSSPFGARINWKINPGGVNFQFPGKSIPWAIGRSRHLPVSCALQFRRVGVPTTLSSRPPSP